jgi:ring-1,2-phenylacetyl-CoA epoxidase subunit PaaE
MNPRFHELKIADVRKETEDTVSVAFEVPSDLEEAYRYEPGQYLTLRQEIGGEDIRRSYSICSGINEDELRVAIKKVPQGKFSTFANESLKVGAVMKVMTPTGGFTTDFNEGTEKNYVFFAAGSGITPVISLIKSILHKSPKSDVIIIEYSAKFLNTISFVFIIKLSGLKPPFV